MLGNFERSSRIPATFPMSSSDIPLQSVAQTSTPFSLPSWRTLRALTSKASPSSPWP